jgi:hypothetical protein
MTLQNKHNEAKYLIVQSDATKNRTNPYYIILRMLQRIDRIVVATDL